MAIKKIKKNILYIGAIDWDRELFDELVHLPDGTSYNSYLIKGSLKTALIDTVDPGKEHEFLENIRRADIKTIDYLIANHAEQDHSGTIPKILELFPDAKVVTNKKCSDFLMSLLGLQQDSFHIIEDGDELSLGDKTLKFIMAPWVHWPETMLTYLVEDKILFSCDLFGSHIATSDLYTVNESKVYEAAKRYYAEIMMPFRKNIQKHMKKLAEYEIEMIAPSHGTIHQNPDFIMSAYDEWISDNVSNKVVIPYLSMHGSTQIMVEYLADALTEKGIGVFPFNVISGDVGNLAISLIDAATIIIATPTFLTGPHPGIVYASYLANALRPKAKFAGIIGSYGWGTKAEDIIKGLLTNVKADFLDSVIIKGLPDTEAYSYLDNLASTIKEKHSSANLL